MNAYELADELDKILLLDNCDQYVPNETPTMLRQQADRIAELEKVSSKPVAWVYQVNGNQQYYSDVLPPDDAYDKGTLIPLYTHPVKQLSDDEIMNVFNNWVNNKQEHSLPAGNINHFYEEMREFARAIIKEITE